MTEKYGDAIRYFEEAKKYFETSDDTLNLVYTLRNEGYAYAMLDEMDEAIQCLKKATDIEDEFGYAQNTKGFVHMRFLDFDQALECFEKATKVNLICIFISPFPNS